MSYVQTFTDAETGRTICLDSDGFLQHRKSLLLKDLQEIGLAHGLTTDDIDVVKTDGRCTIKFGALVYLED